MEAQLVCSMVRTKVPPRPPFTLVAIRRWGPKNDLFPGGLLPRGETSLGLSISKESPNLVLTARTTKAEIGMAGRARCLGLTLDDRGIKVEILDGRIVADTRSVREESL